jgi:tetratricopeptide (TPR) repeat protein
MLLAAYVLQNAQEQAASLCENLEGDALGATRVLCVARRLKAGDEVPAGALVDSQGELLDPRLRLTAAALGVVDPEEEAPSDLLRMLSGDRAMLGRYCAFLGYFELGLYEAAVEEADGLLAGPDPVEGALTAAFQALSQAAMLEDPVARARALAEEHGGSVSWLGLARVAREEGDHDAARNAYERATEADPDNATAWLRFAIYLDTQGEREDALEAYRRAHELDPDNGIVANNLAHTLLQEEGASEEAAELAAQAREALPANPHIAHTLALALFELGRTEEALPHIQMALELRPGDPTFLYDQGRMLVESGQEQEGYNLVQQALLLAERLGLDFPRQDEAAAFLTAGGVEA